MARTIKNKETGEAITGTSDKRSRSQSSKVSPSKKKRTNKDSQSAHNIDEDEYDDLMKNREDLETLFLDGAEGYFDQHKTREKISTTPFSRAPTLEYKEFISYVDGSSALNSEAREFLVSLYHTMFPQWYFELTQGFSLLFYGVGSKRNLLLDFISQTIPQEIPVLVANGYNPSVAFKEILNSLTPILAPDYKGPKFPKNTPDLLQALLDYLDETYQSSDNSDTTLFLPKVVLLIHNINGESFRGDRIQSYLSRLTSAKQIWLVCSIDNINAPIMWDAAKLAIFNFLWHDVTTFESYATETSFDDPLSLGMVRTAAGFKGVKYVLSSLTPKARGLYKVLIYSQIEIMSMNGGDVENTPGTSQVAISLNTLYQKCSAEFLVSNEMNFRTMLTEFIDHKMIVLTKDSSGTELVFIPYTKEAMEKIIEDGHLDN